MGRLAVLCVIAPLLLGFAPTPPRPLLSRSPHAAKAGDELWSDQFALPVIDGWVNCAVFYQGELIIGGRFTQAGGIRASNIARWDGEQWLPLGEGADDEVLALSVFQDRLIVGGRFSTAGTVQSIGVAQWDGAQWYPMGDGLVIPLQVPPAETWAFVEYGGGLVATGAFQQSGERPTRGIAVWNGTQWNPLGEGLNGVGRGLAVWRDSLFVGGFFRSAGGTSVSSIAAWDGATWSPLGSGLTTSGSTAWVYSLAVYQDELIVGGDYDHAGGLQVHNIAAWDGTDWHALGPGLDWGVKSTAIYQGRLLVSEALNGADLAAWDGASWSLGVPLPVGSANCLLPVNDGLIVGGSFQASIAAGGPIRGFQIAKWTGTDWIGFEPWAARMHGVSSLFGGYPFIQSLASYQGELVAGGFLDLAGDPPGWSHVGPIAAWNGARWRPLGTLDTFGQTYALLSQNDTLYAGGTLYGYSNGIGGQGLWKYHGGSWSMIDTLNATILNLVMYQGSLYVGARRGGTPAPFSGGVYRWDGHHLISIAWSDPGITAMTVHNGNLVVAGDLNSFGGVDAAGLASWNGYHWAPMANDPPNPGGIHALASWNGESVAAGQLCQAPGCPPVATLESGTWHSLGNLGGEAECITLANGRLYAGGWLYDRVAYQPVMVTAWDGTNWVGLGSGVNGQVMALQEHDGSLFVGGAFTQAGMVSSYGVGRWSGLPPAPELPRVTRLDPARPNPFRTSTQVPFSVATPGRVRLEVYDLHGRQISVLEAFMTTAGEHLMEWDGLDQSGRRVSGGVYFVRAMMPDGTHLTRKIALVR